jgi:hypothetical protein
MDDALASALSKISNMEAGDLFDPAPTQHLRSVTGQKRRRTGEQNAQLAAYFNRASVHSDFRLCAQHIKCQCARGWISNVNVPVDVADVCGIQSILLSGMKRSRRTVPAPGMLTKLSLSTEEPEMLPPPIFSVTIFKMSTAVWF